MAKATKRRAQLRGTYALGLQKGVLYPRTGIARHPHDIQLGVGRALDSQ